jgi:DNA helicase-4
VDEFQDISLGRAGLIRALRGQVQGAKLFCVGDDWQSIYRFTGSDISLTTDFEGYFGPARRTALDRTFRFHDRIAAFSSHFVQRNPRQLRKRLSTAATSDKLGVVVYRHGEGDDPLPTILAEIAALGAASVFLLGRYGFTAPDDLRALQARFPRLNIRFLTAHGSKGLEADYVVLLGLTSGRHGFPSEVADDPVLGLVLADGEPFAFAEERRLFYVALTRVAAASARWLQIRR